MLHKKIAHYKISEKLGEGGMGVVYKAQDTKLKRTVALKFLPLDRLGTKEEKNRFVREAQAAAALNHSNIATIYSIDEHDGQSFIVMEYIEGETLKEKIAAGPLKLKKALDIASQIAIGLQAAHEQGIVHRDIKSANIMITSKGHVKIMDFGLAKLSGSTMITKRGTTLGTIAYMSPEQARGDEVDYRTDIWALGVVLYEMVTGQLPFKGDYDQALIYSIINEEPEPLSALRSRIPLELERIVEKCLAKNPAARYQNANEIPVDLKAIDISSSSTSRITPPSTVSTMAPSKPLRWKRMLTWTFFTLVFLLAGFSVWRFWLSPLSAPVRRLVINTEENLSFWRSSAVVISPDGKNIVYVSQRAGETKLFLRPMDKFESTPIQGTEGANSPFFSPDGQWLGFYAEGKLKKVSVFGGVPVTLLETDSFFGASWGPNNTIYFSTLSAETNGSWIISKISANGGQAQAVTQSQDSPGHVKDCWPQDLPDGKAVLFTRIPESSRNPDEGRIEVLSLETGERHTILEGGIYARYSPTGHIVAAWSGGLLAVPFDLSKLEVTGPTVPVLDGILLGSGYIPNYTFSQDGSLVFVQGTKGTFDTRILQANRQGVSQPLIAKSDDFYWPKLSPDASQLSVTIEKEEDTDIWIGNLNDGSLIQLTFEGNNNYAIWTPDGKRLTFASDRSGAWNLYWQPVLGKAPAEQLTTGENNKWPTSWSPDGTVLAYHEGHPDSTLDIWLLTMDEERNTRPFLKTAHNEYQAMFSPDGRWIAYTSDRSGRDEIYLQSYPDKGEAVKISNTGGKWPMWNPNGRELYYRYGDKLMAVSITTKPEFTAGTPEELFEVRSRADYMDLSLKSGRFLFVDEDTVLTVTYLNVVLNWFEELNSLVPSGKRLLGIKL
jgi:serine/threonine-protein kinase